MGQIAEAYTATRQRITELVADLDEGTAKAPTPTCPEWSIADVVAHLAGVCADVLAGNLDGVATDPWTAAQVEARRGRSMRELVDEWSEVAPPVEAISDHFPGRVGTQWVLDVTSHEHDIRHALRAPGARDSDGVAMALEFMVTGLATSVAARGLPPLEVRADGTSWVIGGEGETDVNAVLMGAEPAIGGDRVPEATVEAPGFDLFRALTGRRSLDQVRRFAWTGDVERYLPAFTFGPFKPNPVDIDE